LRSNYANKKVIQNHKVYQNIHILINLAQDPFLLKKKSLFVYEKEKNSVKSALTISYHITRIYI